MIQNCPHCAGAGVVSIGERKAKLPDGRTVVVNETAVCYVCRGQKQIDVVRVEAKS